MKNKLIFIVLFLVLLSFLSCGNTKTGSENNNENPDSEIINESEWSVLAAGGHHTCGIKNGELFCWGANYIGQFGDRKSVV